MEKHVYTLCFGLPSSMKLHIYLPQSRDQQKLGVEGPASKLALHLNTEPGL